MQILAEAIVDFNERVQDREQSASQSLADQVAIGMDRFVARSDAGIDKLERAGLQEPADEAEGQETQWHELEQLFDAGTRRGEQVQRELVVAHGSLSGALRRGRQRAFQRLEKRLSALEEELG